MSGFVPQIAISLIVFVGIPSVMLVAASGRRARAREMAKARAALQQRCRGDLFISPYDGAVVGVDFSVKKVWLGSLSRPMETPFADLSAVELAADNATLTTTNRGSQAIGVIAGGLALGGVGALIGGLSGSTRTRQRLYELVLKVTIDDPRDPVRRIVLFRADNTKGIDPRRSEMKVVFDGADRLHAHLVNAMRQVQTGKASKPSNRQTSPSGLKELWSLRQAGALTDAEYESEKAKLLALD
jgi:hypothetical protein